MQKNRKNNVSFRLNNDMFVKLHAAAKNHGQTLAAYITMVLYEAFKNEFKEEK